MASCLPDFAEHCLTSHAWTRCTAPFRPHCNHAEPIHWQLEIQKVYVLVTHATILITSTLLHQTVSSSVRQSDPWSFSEVAGQLSAADFFLGSSSALTEGHFSPSQTSCRAPTDFTPRQVLPRKDLFPLESWSSLAEGFARPTQSKHSSLAPAKLWEFSSLQQSGRLTLGVQRVALLISTCNIFMKIP